MSLTHIVIWMKLGDGDSMCQRESLVTEMEMETEYELSSCKLELRWFGIRTKVEMGMDTE